MIAFDRIVGVALDAMPGRRKHFLEALLRCGRRGRVIRVVARSDGPRELSEARGKTLVGGDVDAEVIVVST